MIPPSHRWVLLFAALAFLLSSTASPLIPNPIPSQIFLHTDATVTPLSTSQIAAYKNYTFYASNTYCPPNALDNWICGVGCQANPQFITTKVGGEEVGSQQFYVGFDPAADEVIVAVRGTNMTRASELLEDADLIFEQLGQEHFPDMPADVGVHSGFLHAYLLTTEDIWNATQATLSSFNATRVTLVGHSLGAAISLLNAISFTSRLPPSTNISFIGYGTPRIGNQAFADYVDQTINVTRINNRKDVVPTLPGMFLGFQHPSGEIHITESGQWIGCSGQENPSEECTDGDVPTVFSGSLEDHTGPYDGIEMGEGC